MKVLDLFSGIGGFSLGLEMAGMETVAFCEIDPKARLVLNKHWPTVPVYTDVKELTRERLISDGVELPDVICGGFPCQDISKAGRGKGLAGERSGLWGEYLRIIQECKPSFVLIENSPVLRRRGLGEVLRGLHEIGYNAEWHCLPASYIGAWTQRDRIWILAYPVCLNGQGGRQGPILGQSDLSRELARGFAQWPGRSNLPASRLCRGTDGVPSRMDRTHQLGNAVVPQIPEIIGRAILAS